ncbi:MAG: histidine kinase [Terriglobales bacterium]
MNEVRPGRLKLFLGYAAGVGKTYRMLAEARALRQAGGDVVIGFFEPHGRKDTMELAASLEMVPRRTLEYRGARFEEMDTEAILRRRPAVGLVDEYAHSNVPGSPRAKRWEDVQALLEAGIEVWTTMNVQHLESLNDQIWQITGVRVRETVPDWVVRKASEVVMVDLTTRALLNRLERGAIYEPGQARRALANFFQESTLAALREMALRQTAHELELRQEGAGGDAAAGRDGGGLAAARPAPPSADRVLIHVTADPSAAMVIRRGWRVANYLHADCYAVHVRVEPERRESRRPEAEMHAVERHLAFARGLRIETHSLSGRDMAATLVEFARQHRVTQIFLARPRDILVPSAARRLVRLAEDMQVIIVAERRRAG